MTVFLLWVITVSAFFSAFFWIVDIIANHARENIFTSVAKTFMVIVLLLCSVLVGMCASDMSSRKCECGTRIDTAWDYCPKCGEMIVGEKWDYEKNYAFLP